MGFNMCGFTGYSTTTCLSTRRRARAAIYNFQYIDDLFDRMLELGVRPFVELSFSPSEMATVKGTTMWWQANGSPPKDYGKWAGLVRASPNIVSPLWRR